MPTDIQMVSPMPMNTPKAPDEFFSRNFHASAPPKVLFMELVVESGLKNMQDVSYYIEIRLVRKESILNDQIYFAYYVNFL